ncbi:Mbeg1-like protein [Salidesulfovibrio onnuriiensis]|uniref:Mbeg1-like protein n=1 Tax=Salidesulfovibrio onnuriiensis TaxID=2583823 RepID=UPI0011C860C5|nr:Mbeg1-like protein [Salidesulfovibrio onnuriiensis]
MTTETNPFDVEAFRLMSRHSYYGEDSPVSWMTNTKQGMEDDMAEYGWSVADDAKHAQFLQALEESGIAGQLSGVGLEYDVYKNENGVYSLAFRGTDGDLADISTDAQLALNKLPRAGELAIDMAKIARETFGSSHLVVTGHSLGGYEAQCAAAVIGVPCVVFDAPGIARELDQIRTYAGELSGTDVYNNTNIMNVVSDTMVSNTDVFGVIETNDHVGTVISINDSGLEKITSWGRIDKHMMYNFKDLGLDATEHINMCEVEVPANAGGTALASGDPAEYGTDATVAAAAAMALSGENELAFTQDQSTQLVGTLNSAPEVSVFEAAPSLAAAAAATGQAELLENQIQALVDGMSGYTPVTAGVMTTPMTLGEEEQAHIAVASQGDFA